MTISSFINCAELCFSVSSLPLLDDFLAVVLGRTGLSQVESSNWAFINHTHFILNNSRNRPCTLCVLKHFRLTQRLENSFSKGPDKYFSLYRHCTHTDTVVGHTDTVAITQLCCFSAKAAQFVNKWERLYFNKTVFQKIGRSWAGFGP